MSEAAIRTEIYNILSGVTNIGKVFDYERWAADWAAFIYLFKTPDNKILGWEIFHKSAADKKAVLGMGSNGNEIQHEFKIRGYMGVSDANATEKTFNILIEAIASAFRSNTTLNGAAFYHRYIQVEAIDTRMFGSVLCHCADLSLVVIERI